MNKNYAESTAIELVKVALSAARPTHYPNENTAKDIAAFITTLTDALSRPDKP